MSDTPRSSPGRDSVSAPAPAPAPAPTLALEARGLCCALGGQTILDSVDYGLRRGEIHVVVGPNGAGKTTLVRALSGLLRPRSGSVELGGVAVSRQSRRAIARQLAVIPQDTPVPFPYTVREMVAMGRAPRMGAFGRESDRDLEQVEAALLQLDLLPLAGRTWPTLSGGERQRVLLARALAGQTELLLFDEPTSHMDLGHRLHTFEWLRSWVSHAPSLRAIALVTHDLMLAARYADTLTVLHRGRVVASGAPAAVLTAERIAQVWSLVARVESDAEGALHIVPLRST